VRKVWTPPIEVIVAIAAWLLAIFWSARSGCNAYHLTPDIEPFQRFVQPSPTAHSGESKIFFLFGPLLLAFAFGIVSNLMSTHWLDATFGDKGSHERGTRLFVSGIFALIMAAVVSFHSGDAIRAAHKMGWHGSPPSNAIIDTVCLVGLPGIRLND
jgi:hypothetical protein